MTNIDLVTRKLGVIAEHLRRLRERRLPDLSAFAQDSLRQDALAMSLLVVVQDAIDIALHLASDEGWTIAPTYREAFTVLARNGVIDATLAESLAKAVQLRNRIAHGYASVDVERLWRELPVGIAAFTDYSAAIAAYLQKPTP